MAVDKKTLIEWLQSDAVSIASADVEGLPGLPGQMVTVIFTNGDLNRVLNGATYPAPEAEETDEQKAFRIAEQKKIQEGWGDND